MDLQGLYLSGYIGLYGEHLIKVRRPWGSCWMVVEGGEGENPRGRGGVGGGYPGFVSLQVPTSEAAVSADTHAFARLPAKNRNLRGLLVGRAPSPGGPGPKAPWRPGLQAPGAWIPPLSPADFLQAEFLTCLVFGVPVFAPAFQPLGRAPSPWRPGQQAPEPCIPAA